MSKSEVRRHRQENVNWSLGSSNIHLEFQRGHCTESYRLHAGLPADGLQVTKADLQVLVSALADFLDEPR